MYYQWFDSAINGWLLEEASVDPTKTDIVGVVGESACSFQSEVRLGDRITIGLAVSEVGSSSLTYVLAAFDEGSGQRAALGHWVHVYVNRNGGTVPIPRKIATAARSVSADVLPATMRKLKPSV